MFGQLCDRLPGVCPGADGSLGVVLGGVAPGAVVDGPGLDGSVVDGAGVEPCAHATAAPAPKSAPDSVAATTTFFTDMGCASSGVCYQTRVSTIGRSEA
jgi:hypothetical protein